MTLFQRYQMLNLWNKVAFWGSLASIIGLILTVFNASSVLQQTHGANSPAVANNSGSITITSTPDALKQTTSPPSEPPSPPAFRIWMRPEVLLTMLGVFTVLAAFVAPLLVPRRTMTEASTPPQPEGDNS